MVNDMNDLEGFNGHKLLAIVSSFHEILMYIS